MQPVGHPGALSGLANLRENFLSAAADTTAATSLSTAQFFAERGLSDASAVFISEGFHNVGQLVRFLESTAGPLLVEELAPTGAWEASRREEILRALQELQQSSSSSSSALQHPSAAGNVRVWTDVCVYVYCALLFGLVQAASGESRDPLALPKIGASPR